MRPAARLVAAAAAALAVLAGPAYAAGAGHASIDHAELDHHGLRLLVSVPGAAAVDPGSVSTTVDGAAVASTATDASTSNAVTRTAILAIDASDSMAGARIRAAERAARAYLRGVPANVEVGVLTFNSTVDLAVPPTLDRAAALAAIGRITLARGTALYDGVARAVASVGTTGQRQVLLLSDGKDTTSTTLASAVRHVQDAGARFDAVTLQAADTGNPALHRLAAAGKGSVIDAATPQALAATYAQAASTLAHQVLVSVTLPARERPHDATVTVRLTAGGTAYTDSAYVHVGHAPVAAPKPVFTAPAAVGGGTGLPWPIALGAIVAIGLALVALAFIVVPPAKEHLPPPSVQDQIRTYGPSGTGARADDSSTAGAGPSIVDRARTVSGQFLSNNRGLEARIEARLSAAGMSVKPSEWLLLHLSVIVVLGAIGLLLSGENIVVFVIFLVFGSVAPWSFLKLRKARRTKAFNAGVADTLQLMSSSLSAGLSLAQSVDTVVREGNEPIRSEFRRVIVETRLGVGIEDALEGVAERMESRDFAWVVMAIRIQREVGGNLAELLNTVADTLREREYLRRHVGALSAEGRLSAYILGGLPPFFLVYLVLTRGAYVHPLFTTPIGWLMCVAMAVMMTVGVVWMSKVTKVEI